MPILRRLRKLDWPTMITELVLIFVGITAALWFDNANEGRAERQLETEVLGELAAALATDTADLNLNLRSSAATLASIDTILLFFDEGRPYSPALADHFRRSSMATNFLQNVGTYEYLKSIGLRIIQNDSLRSQLSKYYEYDVQYLSDIETEFVNGNWVDAMKPQMMEKFSYQFFFGPATPRDYASLTRDAEYRTVLTTTREALEWKDRRSQIALSAAESLLGALRNELGDR